MKKWENIVDRLITDAIGDGDVSHLSGAGKKLPQQDENSTPQAWRAAFKIMADHGVMPEWIATGKQLQQMETALRNQIETRARQFFRGTLRARAEDSAMPADRIDSGWSRYKEGFLERVERYNRELLVYNLKLPSGVPHRQTLQGEALIEQALGKERAKR